MDYAVIKSMRRERAGEMDKVLALRILSKTPRHFKPGHGSIEKKLWRRIRKWISRPARWKYGNRRTGLWDRVSVGN